jgi:hypothetical protein
MKAIPAILTLCGLAALSACFNPDYRADKEFCIDYCDTLDSCWESLDRDTCVRDCLKQSWLEAADDDQLDQLDEFVTCLDGESCPSFLAGEAFRGCWQEVFESAVPSAQCELFCELHAIQSQDCGAEQEMNFDLRNCLDRPCNWDNDPQGDDLADIAECDTYASCADYSECMSQPHRYPLEAEE